MKVRHFNTAFRASLFLFVAFSSFVALSDGECHLEQYPDGTFRIVCEGGTINYTEELVTNHVYIIENCEQLKNELMSTSLFLGEYFSNSVVSASSVFYPAMESWNPEDIYEDMAKSDAMQAYSQLESESFFFVRCLTDPTVEYPEVALYAQIRNIECGSCSTNSGGGGGSSCCDVDLTPILRELNQANLFLSSITNKLSLLGPYIQTISNVRYARMDWNYNTDKYTFNKISNLPTINSDKYRNIITLLQTIQTDLVQGMVSLNNYMGYLTRVQLPSISNDIDVLKSTTTNLYIASTNHFSFFRNMTFQDSPLIDYSQQSTFDSYYDFLTNHYVKVSFKQYNSLVGDEKAKTNWFSRIETLLAALVFNDSAGTNTVDDTYGQVQQNNLINSLDGMSQTSTTQVNLMSSMGDSLLASLRSLNSSFSSAVSMPGEVKLATVGQDNSMHSNIIKFQSSEISQLVEACRCATTLAWCFGGIWLLFLFVSWSVKTSYSLCVFCWSVVSAIFGGGKI